MFIAATNIFYIWLFNFSVMKFFLCFLLYILISYSGYSQIEAKTKDGRDVILNKNGTWFYADSLCNFYTHIETYDNGKRIIYANSAILVNRTKDKPALEIMMLKTSQSVVMNISIVDKDIWCVNNNTEANITFTDGKKITLKNMGKSNCRGNFSCFLSEVLGNEKELKKLSKTFIKSISITYAINNSETTENTTVNTNLSIGEAYRVKTITECLINRV